MSESQLQSEIIKWLKINGCIVIKHSVKSGVPAGTADLSFYCEGFYGFIEVKSSAKAKVQPLQREFIEKMNEWSWAKFVYPENWEEVKAEIAGML